MGSSQCGCADSSNPDPGPTVLLKQGSRPAAEAKPLPASQRQPSAPESHVEPPGAAGGGSSSATPDRILKQASGGSLPSNLQAMAVEERRAIVRQLIMDFYEAYTRGVDLFKANASAPPTRARVMIDQSRTFLTVQSPSPKDKDVVLSIADVAVVHKGTAEASVREVHVGLGHPAVIESQDAPRLVLLFGAEEERDKFVIGLSTLSRFLQSQARPPVL
mmetsp:Transcript_41058/g.98536  ORF Transcript_41058/g.98536 Transcript_41058/m.98536 type:complete len:218 (-) Transcript_41058:109-762(-)